MSDILLDLATLAALSTFLPYVAIQIVLLARNRGRLSKEPGPSIQGRRLLVTIATNGKAALMANRIAATVRSYAIPHVEALVLIEAADRSRYSSRAVVVPGSFRTPNGSTFKCRALHYYSIWLREQGYGSETVTVHLDDDSVPTREYLLHALAMPTDAGQGVIRLRETGRHWFSTVSDLVRIIDCDTYCVYANSRGRPVHVHGEGLAIRADVESRLGWDFGDRVADDYLMGQRLREEGCTFGHLAASVYIAPPASASDFFRQRRRWFRFFHRSLGRSWASNRAATSWLLLREASAPATVFGVFVWATAIVERASIPAPIIALCVANMIGSVAISQYGAYRVAGVKNHLLAAALVLPASVYQALSWFYAMLTRTTTFDTVRKV